MLRCIPERYFKRQPECRTVRFQPGQNQATEHMKMSDNPRGRRRLLAHAQVDASEVYTCEVHGYRTGPNTNNQKYPNYTCSEITQRTKKNKLDMLNPQLHSSIETKEYSASMYGRD
ncbi:hypothetical protein DFH28DRAFT_1113163 [Melampsora americana]|nr:hypothetical protein DFH28DRAFT_1113163 [Melampsora americana]